MLNLFPFFLNDSHNNMFCFSITPNIISNCFISIYNNTVSVDNFSVPEYNTTILIMVTLFVLVVFIWCFYKMYCFYKNTLVKLLVHVFSKDTALSIIQSINTSFLVFIQVLTVAFIFSLYTLYANPIPSEIAKITTSFLGTYVYDDPSRDIVFDFYFFVITAKDAQEIFSFVLIIILGYYRAIHIVAKTDWNKYVKAGAMFISAAFVRLGTLWIMVSIKSTGYDMSMTLAQVFTAYNTIVNFLLFYVICFGIISIVIFVCEWEKSNKYFNFPAIMQHDAKVILDSTLVVIKIVKIVCLFGITQNLFFLYNHTLPIEILGTGSEHFVLIYLSVINFYSPFNL